jgi:hypothetical protein
MKNTLLVILALVLALAMATGCGLIKKQAEPIEIIIGEDVPASPAPPAPSAPSAPSTSPAPAENALKGWPSEYLPPGFPVYPNGVVAIVDHTKRGVSVFLNETDVETLNSYVQAVEANGWEKDNTSRDGEYILSKDGMFVNTYPHLRLEGQVGIEYIHINQDWWPVWPDMDWTGIPAALPEYPSENINVIVTGLEAVYARIGDSSKTDFIKYFDDVVKAGWDYHSIDVDSDLFTIFFLDEGPDIFTILLEKDNWSLYLTHDKDDDFGDGEDNSRVDILVIPDNFSDDDFAYDFRVIYKAYSQLPESYWS